ncbi:ARM REPEAT PROTEIN INTERACTING WITH ABF2-like isoform X2 [Arachis stenosperma]|uniref:ARM REPEAT PROTEIN INTERACTING WITH ABF2-like isoform X2 n=1 Tax=Arachis stenosperma TaxID=217475 RepID=UPI0025AD5DF5|nr:ARM REPEAT PROTEIN INTERACTING WITH ABF2-like isoform X2 [Arachis stenosperma]
MFEGKFFPRVFNGDKWSHEKMSAKMIDYMVDEHNIDIDPELLKKVKEMVTSSCGSATQNEEKGIQRHVALAHLCPIDDCRTIFIGNNGLELLLELLGSTNLKLAGGASLALHKLATRAISVPLIDVAPSSSTPHECLGKHCVNNSTIQSSLMSHSWLKKKNSMLIEFV